MTEKNIELLPCPFCGSEAKAIYPSIATYYKTIEIMCSNKECKAEQNTLTQNESTEATILFGDKTEATEIYTKLQTWLLK